eukprot:s83_g21.t2
MGMWAANRHFGITGIKCCRAFRAVTGEALLAAGDISHQVKLFHFPSLSGKQGFHRYDGHAGFVSCMATLPGADPTTAAALLTLGGDDGALLRLGGSWMTEAMALGVQSWSCFGSCLARRGAGDDPPKLYLNVGIGRVRRELREAFAVGWDTPQERPPHEAMRLREGTKAAAPRRRPPWDFEDAGEEALKGRGAAPGPWVQHGGTDLPYAEQLEEPLSRRPKGAAGAATTSLAAEPKPRRASLTVAAAAVVAAERAAGKTTAAKDERPTHRQHGGLFAERHWLDSGAIIASVVRQVRTNGLPRNVWCNSLSKGAGCG